MSSHGLKLSIGMPVYNGERYLDQALESILTQSFEDFEVVISDNASTDRTGEICLAYARRDERIRYFRMRQNYGVIDNFNNVFRLSTGEYFKWAASDDVCGPNYLLRAVQVLDEDSSVVLAWAKTSGIDEHGQRVPLHHEVSDLNSSDSVYSPDPVVRFRRLIRNIWWVDGPIYGVIRASSLAETRWLHPRHMSGDQILLTELGLKGRFFEIPDVMFFSRAHEGKTSRRQRTLGDRAALVDQRSPGRGILRWWRLLRGYPQRLAMYSLCIADAPLSWQDKLICHEEVLRAVVTWGSLRTRQVASGNSPW